MPGSTNDTQDALIAMRVKADALREAKHGTGRAAAEAASRRR
jgi:hypothetical protein